MQALPKLPQDLQSATEVVQAVESLVRELDEKLTASEAKRR